MVNMMVLLNLVIAILSEKYIRLAPLDLGLYYDNLISSLPAMKYNKEYGYMILLPPPFNLLYLPFMPFWVIKFSDEKQRKLNKLIIYFIYSIFSVALGCGFIAANLLMFPPAYLYSIAKKLHIICKQKD
jgi:hypothetical protein